jgi:hypothetical protein
MGTSSAADAAPSYVRQKPVTYSLFGLAINSAVPLPCPELPHPRTTPDVELLESSEPQLAAVCNSGLASIDDDGFWQCFLYQDGSARVCWREHFEFAVSSDGRRVRWRKLDDVPDEVLFTYLLGQVLSFCLLARGIEPLHATGIVVEGEAIALLGGCGFGKSTLAAAFLSRGYPMLTDDVLVLEFEGQTVLAHPSLPRVKLTPESAATVLNGRQAIPMNRFTSKMIFELKASQHVAHVVPLRAVYLLPKTSSGSRIQVRRVHGRASFIPIIKNTFNDSVLAPERLKQQFAFAAQLANAVPIKRLAYPKRLELLPAVVDAILADVTGKSKAR